MSLPSDYQWPVNLSFSLSRESDSKQFRRDLYEDIEKFFAEKYKCHALLFPSGRSALSAIMQFKKCSRNDVVYTSKWVSKCVFDVIGAYSNPSVIMGEEVTKVLLVHKWGKVYKAPARFKGEGIIEDSVDSFLRDESALFPNGGEFEVLSLPKLIGCSAGGIALTRNEYFVSFVRSLQGTNMELADWQSRLKLKRMTSFSGWADAELSNFTLVERDLLAIIDRLSHWESCQKIILERLNALSQKVAREDLFHTTEKRLGPVLPLDREKYSLGSLQGVMSRNFSFESDVSRLKFKNCLIIPLHFAVERRLFDQFMANLSIIA